MRTGWLSAIAAIQKRRSDTLDHSPFTGPAAQAGCLSLDTFVWSRSAHPSATSNLRPKSGPLRRGIGPGGHDFYSWAARASRSRRRSLPPRRPRRRRPQHPGIRNASLSRSPSRKLRITSSTWPQICEITWTPAERRATSSGQEIAPQMSTSAGSWATCRARLVGSVVVKLTSRRPTSWVSATSMSKRFSATSKTGETRLCHWGIAILINFVRHNQRASRAIHPFIPISVSNIRFYSFMPLGVMMDRKLHCAINSPMSGLQNA